ncbi:hypothetical protein [Nonomuraea sp. NPDC050783]|uniref:hypothetical protein n=1 Tax=Nonomuraea sp. NPDC050783 TaxID=3154634 RepID=UPI003465E49F
MKRLALLMVAASAAVLLTAPPALADGAHHCFFGDLTAQDADGYDFAANGCDGTGYGDVVVTVLGGTAAGVHRCRYVFPWNGTLGAYGCAPA